MDGLDGGVGSNWTEERGGAAFESCKNEGETD